MLLDRSFRSIRFLIQVEGQIALVERGDCSFVSKVVSKPSDNTFSIWINNTLLHRMQVIKAQEAGAVGVIVADRVIFTLLLIICVNYRSWE